MAANKFATMMNRNTNKITLILIYALLEWILIAFLLLNSLFSYLILKFADYFGLSRPCLWCSRLDQLFDSGKAGSHYRDLVCEDHAGEISNIGFCSNHRKLVELQDLCEECLPSDTAISNGSETRGSCSCCGLSGERKLKSPSSTGDLAAEEGEIGGVMAADSIRSDVLGDRMEEEFGQFMVSDGGCGEGKESHPCPCSSAESRVREMLSVTYEDEKLVMVMEVENEKEEDQSVFPVDDDSKKNEVAVASAPHLEFYIGDDDFELVPVEWVKPNGGKQQKLPSVMEEDDGGCQDVIIDFCLSAKPHRSSRRKKAALFPIQESDEEHDIEHFLEAVEADSAELDDIDNVQEAAEVDSVKEGDEHFSTAEIVLEEAVEGDSNKEIDKQDDNVLEAVDIDNVQEEAEVDSLKEGDELFPTFHTVENVLEMVEASSTEERNNQAGIAETADVPEHGNVLQETAAEERYVWKSDDIDAEVSIGEEIPDLDHEVVDDIETHDTATSTNHEVLASGNDHENEDNVKVEEGNLEFIAMPIEQGEQAASKNVDDSFPEDPTSIDTLHKKLLLPEKKEWGMSEESLDGSVTSEIEGGEGPVTMETLKSALKAERKALHALYAELEEERSASAVGASQTMAMINRLQEEKAAMQMEALQYQRMMEEQAEYDQEALQLLNDLMVKRENEKRELEKELEAYRRKVEELAVKEKMAMLLRGKEDSEGFSVDLNDEAKEEDGFLNPPSDAILYLESSLANFEEERESILDQLKVLEENILSEGKENGNGHCAMNLKQYRHGRFMGQKAKTLLPLFNATGEETEHWNKQDHDGDWLQKTPPDIEMENYNVDIEEEVGHLYERLQVLETDREFLKHCISSLRKGDKGLPILQEILQHLRDLRSIELHDQDITDGIIV